MASTSCDASNVIDDIEDIIGLDADLLNHSDRLERQDVQTNHKQRQRRRKRQERLELDPSDSDNPPPPVISIKNPIPSSESNQLNEKVEKNEIFDPNQMSTVPGVATVFVKTWGCAHNNSDGEYMAGLLSEYGYHVVTEDDEGDLADIWLLNSCTVKGPAESHFTTSISEAQSKGKKVVLAGCVPQAWGQGKSGVAATMRAKAQDISVIGVQQIDRVVEVVEETLKGNTVRLMGTKTKKVTAPGYSATSSELANSSPSSQNSNSSGTFKSSKIKLGGARLDLPKIRRNPLVEIVPISTGCLNACTYCKTKHARGHLGSYPIEEIVERIRTVVAEGVLEIWLTSEDTGAYGRDIGTDITKLLWSILEVLPEPVMLRMGMTNPPYILEHIHEMAKIYSHPRIYSYLHIPIQSASDNVLEAMKREYTRKDFEKIIDTLKSHHPSLNIATDLIIGFPGETHEDYRQTWDLVQQYKFSVLFINQFYPRPGTPAAKMKRVNTIEVKERTKELSTWFKSYMPYDGRIGEVHNVLVTELAPDSIHVAGRTKSYEMVLIENQIPIEETQEFTVIDNFELMGKVVEVEIVRTGKFFLMGRPTKKGLANLSSQPQPEQSVLRRKKPLATGPPRAAATTSIMTPKPKQRMDYHEGDDGEDDDIIEEDCDADEEGCGSCDCTDSEGACCTSGDSSSSQRLPESLSRTSINNPTKSFSTGGITASKTSHPVVGPSDKINLRKFNTLKLLGLNFPQNVVAVLIVAISVMLIMYPWLKQALS